jgi:5-methylcytosine-specific restriction endonuclease McrA
MADGLTRACKKCGKIYSLDRTNLGSTPAGGLRYECRNCVRERVREHDSASPERKQAARERVERRRDSSFSISERATLISLIIRRDGGRRCFYCTLELSSQLHIDHKNPVVKGGSSKLENLVITCMQCNQEKHGKDIEEYRKWRYKNNLPVRF